jgi:hypothetical protein
MEQYQSMGMEGTKNKSTLLLVGGIVLIIALAVLGWFVLSGQKQESITPIVTPTAQEPDNTTAALNMQSPSDELSAIDSDVNTTDLNALNDIDKI